MRNIDRNNLGNNRLVILLMVAMILLVMLFVSSKQGDTRTTTGTGGSGGGGSQKTNPSKPSNTRKTPDKGAFLVQFKNSTGEKDAELGEFFNISRVLRPNQKVLRNISFIRYFSGTWDVLPTTTTTPSPAANTTDVVSVIAAAAAAAAASNTSKKKKSSPSLNFVNGNHGEFYVGDLKLLRHKGNVALESDTIVDGTLMLRDGAHSTDYTVEYAARGSYFWKLGTLLLLGCTTRTAPNVTFVAPGSTDSSWFVRTFMSDSFEFLNAGLSKANPNVTVKSVCPLRAVLKVSSLVDDKEVKSLVDKRQKSSRGEKKRSTFLGSDVVIIDGTLKHVGSGPLKVQGGVHNMRDAYVKVSYFVTFFVLLGISEYVLTLRQIRSTSSLAALSKISPKAICLQCMLDVYISIFTFIVATSFSQSTFYELAIASLVYFTKFSMCDMRYLITVWKASSPSLFGDGDQMRRRFMFVYLQIYGILFACFIIVYLVSDAMYLLVILAYSMWVPQVFKNMSNDTYGPLSWHYVIGMSFSRMFVPLYFLSYNGNFLAIEGNKIFGVFLVIYVAFQVLALLAQKKLGPRFFVPKQIHPKKYDYHRMIPQEVLAQASNGRLECLICMEHVHVPQEEGDGEGKSIGVSPSQLEEGDGSEMGPYVITPCNHVYHEQCLARWLECKFECPACRATIPPM